MQGIGYVQIWRLPRCTYLLTLGYVEFGPIRHCLLHESAPLLLPLWNVMTTGAGLSQTV